MRGLLIALLVLTSSAFGGVNDRTCADLTYAEANNAVNGTQSVGHTTWATPCDPANGCDKVSLPSGTEMWDTTLQITKSITLQGNTVITESVAGDPTTMSVTDHTIIQDGTTGAATPGGNVILLNLSANTGTPVIRGITFDGTTRSATGGVVLYVKGKHHGVRITQCNFLPSTRYIFWVTGETFGVMDLCHSLQTAGSEKISTNADTYDNGTNGDGGWNDGPHVLLNDTRRSWQWFFEDCFFDSPAGKHGSHDGQSGGRRTIRHCYLRNVPMGLHGTESGGRHRGMRLCENYLNTVVYDIAGGLTGTQWRAGSGYVWGNTYTAHAGYGGFDLTINRQYSYATNYSWGAANGANPLDANDSDGDGNYTPPSEGGVPHIFYSGTITVSTTTLTQWAGIYAPDTITITGLPDRDWTGFSISDTSCGSVGGTPVNNNAPVALIHSNVGNVLTTDMGANQNSPTCTWAAGDTVKIYHIATTSLDQPGSGKADALSVGIPITTSDWPNQNTEPIFAWMNTRGGVPYTDLIQLPQNPVYPTQIENRDFFNGVGGVQTNATTPFNGTHGTGYGTHANRPTTCTPGWSKVSGDGPVVQPQGGANIPGVAYWETDTSTLFACTDDDTWTAYYQPYSYPHPLTGASLGKLIDLSGNMEFGNVIEFETGTTTLHVSNIGDTLLTVASVGYDSVFTGSTSGFTVAGGATHDITITASPVDVIDYNGTITVNSDADSGGETIATHVKGVSGPNQRPFDTFFKIKRILSKWLP